MLTSIGFTVHIKGTAIFYRAHAQCLFHRARGAQPWVKIQIVCSCSNPVQPIDSALNHSYKCTTIYNCMRGNEANHVNNETAMK